jgi:hypothetical protein
MNEDERAELEAWRAYYRGEGPSPGGVVEREPDPRGPVPLSDLVAHDETQACWECGTSDFRAEVCSEHAALRDEQAGDS